MLQPLVVIVRDSDEHPNVRAVLKIQDHPRILNRLPRRFQQQPLLRIDVGCLAWGDPEELRVKLVYRVQEPAAFGYSFANQSRFRIEKACRVPPVRRHIRHRLAPLC